MQFVCQRLKIIVSHLFIVVYKFHNLYTFENYDEKCRIVAIECGKLATEQIYSANILRHIPKGMQYYYYYLARVCDTTDYTPYTPPHSASTYSYFRYNTLWDRD